MNVVVLINGREAIPVRAIPFVSGRWMPPDVVARSFARTDHWRDMKDVPAYQLLGGAIQGPVLPKEWDVVEDLLQALESRLHALSDDRTVTRPIWIIESTALLPPAVFVWKDQFEQYFHEEYSPQRFHWVDERPGDRELNFSPMIMPPELRNAVMEGFESRVENTRTSDSPPHVPCELPFDNDPARSPAPPEPERETASSDDSKRGEAPRTTPPAQQQPRVGEQAEIVRKRSVFIGEFRGMWRTIESDLRDGSKNGLSETANARHGFWKIAPALDWAAERGKLDRDRAEKFVRAQKESDLAFLLRAILDRR